MAGKNRHILLWMTFAILYVPFVYEYGVQYAAIGNVDLPSFWTAARAVFRLHASPYDPGTLSTMLGGRVYPFLYPPPSLLAFFPLSLLDYEPARVLVLWVNHVALLWLLYEMCFRPPVGKRAPSDLRLAFAMTYTLSFNPIVVTLNHGQTNIVIALLLLAFWRCATLGRTALAAASLTAAALFKPHLLLVLLVPLLLGRLELVAATGAISGAVVLFSAIVLPDSLWTEWARDVLPAGGYGQIPKGLFSPAGVWNQSFNGFLSRFSLESPWSVDVVGGALYGRVASYLLTALALAASVVALLRIRRSGDDAKEQFGHGMAIVTPLVYLVAPFSWEHHLVYLLPTILYQLNRVEPDGGRRERRIAWVTVVPAALLAFPFALPLKCFCVLALWGTAMRWSVR